MDEDASRQEDPLVVRSKIWIERNDVVVISDWRVELLEAIDAHGSLRRAAEQLNVPYRTAWDRVKATEAALGIRLLDTESGGADGGGSHLTPQAREVCRRFRRMTSGVQEVITRRFQTEFHGNE
ncbi:MAG: LysR family transcriptional regulator [Thermomicrobiales bacterium]|jgi:molybdate transport system regulatory protein